LLAFQSLSLAIPLAASANSGVGEGSSDHPYQITNCDHLEEIQNDQSADYVLMNSFSCSSVNSGAGFNPISDFSGTLDGRNYTVSGLTVNATGNDTANGGLFNQTHNATILDLKLTGLSITYATGPSVGSLVGRATSTTVSNVSVAGSISGQRYVGGLIGFAESGSSISRSSVVMNVTDTNSYVGGFIDELVGSTVTDSYATVNVNGQNSAAGFINDVESNSSQASSVTNSYVTGTVVDANYQAGFINTIYTADGTAATISNDFDVTSSTFNSAPTSLQPFTSVSGGTPNVSGFYFDAHVADTPTCGAGFSSSQCTSVNVSGSDASHFKGSAGQSAAPQASWDFSSNWQENTNGYPTLIDGAQSTVNPTTVPNSPDSLNVTPGDSLVNMSWDAPSDDGGSPITGYEIDYQVAGDSSWTVANANSPYTYISIGLLTNDVTYNFRVIAINAIGNSSATEEDNVIVGLPPSAPQNFAAYNNSSQAAMTWDAPSDPGSSAITGYLVSYEPTGSGNWSSEIGVGPSSLSAGLNGLTPGYYDFRVRAQNDNGYSDYAEVDNIAIGPASHLVSSCQDLQDMQLDTGGLYTLTGNIDCSMTNPSNDNFDPNGTWGNGAGFQPITNFTGTIVGDGYTIDGLYINQPENNQVGIIGDAEGDVAISDLTLTNETVIGNTGVGGLIGISNGSLTLADVNVTASISGYANLGGFVGDMESNGQGDVTIDSSQAAISMDSGSNNEANDWGGMVGYTYAQDTTLAITNSNASIDGSQFSNGSEMGGIIGEADTYDDGITTISNDTASGELGAASQVGGLVGDVYTEWDDGGQPAMNFNNDTSSLDAAAGDYAGGAIGAVENEEGVITLSMVSNTGAVSVDDDSYAGGLIGDVSGSDFSSEASVSIDQSFATGGVTGDGTNETGGIVGGVDTVPLNISNSYSNQAVQGDAETGGLVGYGNSPVTITNSYAAGLVEGSADVGGLVGYLDSDGIIENAFNSAVISSIDPSSTGGVVGVSDSSNIESALDVNAAGLSNCFGNMSNGEMCLTVDTDGSQQDVFMGSDSVNNYPLNQWDFEGIWITQPGQLPQLQWSYTPTPPTTIDISTCQQLQDINNDVTASYALTQNIDCSDSANWNDGSGFLPIARVSASSRPSPVTASSKTST